MASYQYNGVRVTATRRRSSTRDDKKYMRDVTYNGQTRVVHYGDPDMEMQRDVPERREAFLERHSCSTKKDPFAPGFWACYDWQNVDENEAMGDYLIDAFVTTTAGEPFRLFPFGQIIKAGKVRQLTRELAAKFKLPHFKPPIKLGSHRDETPAAGHIVALEVRDDGLYAVPEWNDEGAAALARGAYRYHSPEIIWEGGGLEDATSGAVIAGPLIVGDALLHMPALGEAAALYHVAEVDMTETVTVPLTWFDRLLNRTPEPVRPEPQPEPAPAADTFEAERADYQAQIADYEAKLAALEAERQQEARVAQFAAELAETAVADDADLAVLLAGLPDEQAGEIVRRFKALSAQIDTGLTNDVGHAGELDEGDPVAMFDAAAKEAMREHGMTYPAAVLHVQANRPELYRAYAGGA